MKYEDYDNEEEPSQQEQEEEEEEEEVEVSIPKKAMPAKGRERNTELRSKESSYENTGSGADYKKNNGRFRSSRMDDEEEDEAEVERRAIEQQ
jgi:hypothetical protein